MDYKYIEQLVERYFQCETTVQEEQILRTFFAQDDADVPQQLRQWQPLFAAIDKKEQLGDDFESRILAMTEESTHVKARTVSLNERLRPLYKAAAIVAVVLALGQAMNISTKRSTQAGDDIDYANYSDTYDDPSVAYEEVEDALLLMGEELTNARKADSLMSVYTPQADSVAIN